MPLIPDTSTRTLMLDTTVGTFDMSVPFDELVENIIMTRLVA